MQSIHTDFTASSRPGPHSQDTWDETHRYFKALSLLKDYRAAQWSGTWRGTPAAYEASCFNPFPCPPEALASWCRPFCPHAFERVMIHPRLS